MRQVAWRDVRSPARAPVRGSGRRAVPAMVTDGVRCAPTADGRLPRPSQLTYASSTARVAAVCGCSTHTRVTGISLDGHRVRGVQTDGVTSRQRWSSTPAACSPPRSPAAGVRVPVVPFAARVPGHAAVPGAGPRASTPDAARSRPARVLPRGGAGLVMGGYERRSGRGRSMSISWTASHPTSTGGSWRRTGPGRGNRQNSSRRVPRWRGQVTRLINGPEAFTPDNEFCLGESDVRGFFVAAGFCAHGLAGAGGIGKVMAEWILAGEPSLDVWEMDIRRFGAHYRSPRYTLARAKEVYETYYDIRYPGHERQPDARCGRRARTPGTPHTAPRSARSPAGSASTGTSRTPGRATSRCVPGGGRACTGPRRSAPSTSPHARPPGCSTSPRLPSSKIAGPGAAELLERLCDNRVAREVGRSPTPRC